VIASRAALGALCASVVLTALVAATRGSPLQPMVSSVEPGGFFGRVAHDLRLGSLPGTALAVLAFVAMAGAVLAFCAAAYGAWRGLVSVRTVVVMALVFHATVLMLPLLLSNDVPSYVIYGRLAGVYHANPYVVRPSAAAGDPFLRYVDPVWRNTTSVYGPLFTALSAWLTTHIHTVPRLVLAFKAIAAAASLATLAVVVWLTRRVAPGRAAFAAFVFACNPVLLFNGVGSGHNDLILALAIAGAVALLWADHEYAATAALSVATMVKYTAALPLLLLVVWAVARRSGRARWWALAVHGALAGAIGAVLSWPFLQASNPTLGVLTLSQEQRLAPARVARHTVESVVRRLANPSLAHAAGLVVRLAFEAVLAVAVVALARELASRPSARPPGLARSWGWALLFLVLTAPALLPWYIVWVLPLVWLLPTAPRLVAVGMSAALAVWEIPASQRSAPVHVYDAIRFLTGHAITVVAFASLCWLAVALAARMRRASAGDADADDLGGDLGGKEVAAAWAAVAGAGP
jgi:hypothetical protein